MGTTLQSHTIV